MKQDITSINWKKLLRNCIIVLICIFLNFFGRYIASELMLPGWFDSYGTFIAAYLIGPVCGAVCGLAGNLLAVLLIGSSPIYMIVSIFLGIAVGLLARKGYFEVLFYAMTVAGIIAAGTVLLTSIINIIFFSGSTGNIWGDGVIAYLLENGSPKWIADIIGQLYIEFPDKLLTVLVVYILVHSSRLAKNRNTSNTAAAGSLVLVLTLLLNSAFALSPFKASSADDAPKTAYIQTIYNGANGLVCGHANALAETKDGIIWIGTYAGLYRYNGIDFIHLNNFNDIRNVNCLYVDSKQRLIVGTNDNGVVIINKERVSQTINTRDGLPSDSIRSIVQASDGSVYIGTSGGTAVLDSKANFTVKNVIQGTGYTNHLTADAFGHVAAVNSEGELFILKKGSISTEIKKAYNGEKISSCNFNDDNVLYVGTADGYISEYNIDRDVLSNTKNTKCDGVTKINNVYSNVNGQTWICADNGIGYLNKDRKFFSQKTGDFDHSIESMITDYQGNLWFASSRLGLLQLSRSSVTDIFADIGLKPTVVNSSAIHSGSLFVGTDDGLVIVDRKKNTLVENELTDLLQGSRIRCICSDSSGKLWICSYGTGLVSMEQDGSVISYTDKIKELGNRVRMCCELSDGTLAVSSSNGLFFIKDGELSNSIPYNDEFGYAQVLCIAESKSGRIYAGTDGNGIAVIENGKFTRKLTREDGLTSEVILKITPDTDSDKTFVVTSNSICIMTEDSITPVSNFPYSNNYDVTINDDGRAFVTGSAGIYVISKDDLLNDVPSPDYKLLNSRNGLECSLTANAWNCTDNEGNIYLSADRGVFAMSLSNYLLDLDKYIIHINDVKLDDKTIPLIDNNVLSVERDVIKMEFVPEILDYTHNDPTVSYILEGFDKDWTYIRKSELYSVQYTNLQPGSYTFRIAVRDDDNNIISESSYTIEKKMAIYDNRWFKHYMLGVAAIFIGWLTWFITRTMIQRTLKKQQDKLALALQQVQMGNETILAIAKTVDAKDERTSKHSQRVSEYSALIAKEYGFSEKDQENIRRAALLHDIGKIGIPDSVLNKPGRLTDEEYAVMKTHVTRGAEILKDFTLIEHVVEGARYHHERYDGKGYPDHLAGEEIPLYGRIISIADAFDAMTANRVYRKRQDFDYVMGELHKGRGTQFDPDLLDIFLKLIDEKKIDIDALYSNAPAPEEKTEDNKNTGS